MKKSTGSRGRGNAPPEHQRTKTLPAKKTCRVTVTREAGLSGGCPKLEALGSNHFSDRPSIGRRTRDEGARSRHSPKRRRRVSGA